MSTALCSGAVCNDPCLGGRHLSLPNLRSGEAHGILHDGIIDHANELAQALGVAAGQARRQPLDAARHNRRPS